MNLPFDISLIPKDGLQKDAKEHVADLKRRLQIAKEIATENIEDAQARQKEYYDKNTDDPHFRLADKVLLQSKRVPKGLSPKLQPPWDGPFYIVAQGPNNTYKIRRCDTHKELKSPVHANRLKSFHEPIPENNDPAPAVLGTLAVVNRPNDALSQDAQDPVALTQQTTQDDETIADQRDADAPPASQIPRTQEGYVEKFIKYKALNGKRHFLVKWVGHSNRTWGPVENIPSSLVNQFYLTKTQRGTKRKSKRGMTCFKRT